MTEVSTGYLDGRSRPEADAQGPSFDLREVPLNQAARPLYTIHRDGTWMVRHAEK
jgi:hypothetical protein